MKLSEVHVRDKVPTGAPGDLTARLKSDPGPGPAQGWELTYEAGMVTARKGLEELLIPFDGQVTYMKREAPAAKVAKGKDAA